MKSEQLTIGKAFQIATTTKLKNQLKEKPKVVTPQCKPVRGKTTHYPRFCIDENEDIATFVSYLSTADGGRKSSEEARAIVQDVSKYLYFANNEEINMLAVLDHRKLNLYQTKLLDEGVGIEAVLTKLDRMAKLLDYLSLEKDINMQEVDKMKTRLFKWKQGIRKQRKGFEADRLDQATEHPPDTTAVKELLSNKNILAKFLSFRFIYIWPIDVCQFAKACRCC